jgi:hypothetical protein
VGKASTTQNDNNTHESTLKVQDGNIISYLCVYPWALRLYHPEVLLYSLRRSEGCTVVLKGGTISMPTGRHIDNDFIPGLKTKTDF